MGATVMKYLVMVQGTQADYDAQSGKGSPGSPVWDEKAMREMFAYMGGINDDLAETGELVTGYGLRGRACCCRQRAGAGPYRPHRRHRPGRPRPARRRAGPGHPGLPHRAAARHGRATEHPR